MFASNTLLEHGLRGFVGDRRALVCRPDRRDPSVGFARAGRPCAARVPRLSDLLDGRPGRNREPAMASAVGFRSSIRASIGALPWWRDEASAPNLFCVVGRPPSDRCVIRHFRGDFVNPVALRCRLPHIGSVRGQGFVKSPRNFCTMTTRRGLHGEYAVRDTVYSGR